MGTLLKNNGNLNYSLEDLAKKGRKVLFSIKAKTSSLGYLPIEVSNNLFDKLVRPVLTYNSEISFMDGHLPYYRAKIRGEKNEKNVDPFYFIDKTPFEKVHLNFCKFQLGVKKSASNIGARAELGRLPIEHFVLTQSLIYLARLNTEKINPLLKEAFELSKSLNSSGTYSWYTYIKNIVHDDDLFSKIENCKNLKEVHSIKIQVKRYIEEKYKSLVHNKLYSYDETNKLCFYKEIKQSLNKEFYLTYHDFSIRKCFSKLRISDHNLEIERGRYFKIPRKDRLCKFCHIIETEDHFILHCKINNKLRLELFENLNWKIEDQNINKILNPSSKEHVKLIGSFLKQSLELRTEVA